MSKDKSKRLMKYDYDIVVVGAGGSGLAAAITAAEKGVNVVLIEKRRAAGGNTVFAEGFFAAESPAQKRMMIDAKRDDLFKKAMEYSHWAINPRIVRAFINKSGDTVQWLEAMGLKFNWIPPVYPNQVPLVWHCLERGGAMVVKRLVKNCCDNHLPVLYNTAAKHILVNREGKISGVNVVSQREEFIINARSVIITTGGYAGNKKLLKKYCKYYTENMSCGGLPHMGDGLIMATEIGAKTEGLGILQAAGPEVKRIPGIPGSKYLAAIAQEPNTIWINKNGERFVDEATSFNPFESVNALKRQPEMVSYTVFDDKIRTTIANDGLIKGLGITANFVPPQTKVIQLDRIIRQYQDKGRARVSDSWDDLAKWIGADPTKFTATIHEYNNFCRNGYDEIFAKDRRYLITLDKPPYYAIQCFPGFLGTIGGIKVNHYMNVVNNKELPIQGLFAAGVDVGGWESDTYCLALSGSTFGFALNSGRIAGENAAKYIGK